MRPPNAPAPVPLSPDGGFFPWIVGAFGAVVTTVWAGAALAAAVTGHPGAVTFTGAGRAILRLPSHLSSPGEAWPASADEALPGPVIYWACQLVVLVVLVLVGVVGWRLWSWAGADRPRPFGVDPEAGFATRRDLDRLAVPEPTPGRVTIGRSQGRLVATELDASLAVVGPSGCGKTAGFAIPAILEWKGPILATSVKADLIAATITHRASKGHVWVYDPTGCSGHPGSTWSPLDACRTWAGAMRVAAWMAEAAQARNDTLADGDYWYSQARKGLAPYLHAAAASQQTMATLVRWIDTQEETDVETALLTVASVDPETGEVRNPEEHQARLKELTDASIALARDILIEQGGEAALLGEQEPADWPPWLIQRITNAVQTEWALELGDASGDPLAPLTAARALWRKEDRLKGSVFATIENVLAGWTDPAVTAAASSCDINLDQWLAGDNTLYIVATAHEQARLRPVLTTLVQQAIRRAYDTASVNKGGRLSHPCLVLLDEAGNTAPLRDLPGYASTARSHGITLVTIWQDLAQIRAAYRDRAQTVLNNHRAKLFGSGIADGDTLEYVSKLIGDEARTERNLSSDLTGGRRSVSEHRTWRRTAPADVIRRIQPGDAALLYGSELPVHVRLRPWFAEPDLQRLAPDQVRTTEPTRRNLRALLHR